MPSRAIFPFALIAALAVGPVPPVLAQQPPASGVPTGPGGADPSMFRAPPLDLLVMVMSYNRLNGTTIDFRPYAEQSTAYRNATTFDRPDVLVREIARLEGQFTTLDLGRIYLMRLGTTLRQYDATRRGYPVGLSPEAFIPMADPVTFRGYGVQFRNADEVAFVPVGDSAAARIFAQRYGLNMQYESAGEVALELAYRLVEAPPGVGGGVTIVRADVLAARVSTRNGQPMWDFGQTAAGRGPAPQASAPGTVPLLKAVDVQGIRVGMPLAEGAGIASRSFPTQRYSDSRGGRWFRNISPEAEARASGMHADTALRCGLDPLSFTDEMARRQMGESTEVTPSDASEACLGFNAAEASSPLTRERIGRITSGQRLAGATVETVRKALTDKYGPPTYTRGGQTFQWIGRDPARPDGGLVSITARVAPREGGMVLGVEAVPHVDPNTPRAPAPATAPATPRL